MSASDIAICLQRSHPEYGARCFETVHLSAGSGPRTQVDDWLALVPALYPADEAVIDGRRALAGLAELDPSLEAMFGAEFLAEVRREAGLGPPQGIDSRLDALLGAYKSAMKFIDQMPMLSRWPVVRVPGPSLSLRYASAYAGMLDRAFSGSRDPTTDDDLRRRRREAEDDLRERRGEPKGPSG